MSAGFPAEADGLMSGTHASGGRSPASFGHDVLDNSRPTFLIFDGQPVDQAVQLTTAVLEHGAAGFVYDERARPV
ncbi:hypothetical protein [Sphaerisporangium perillae]|uniref:hypothetical protein n=1 Tax=Sphaerisporangium perillae TaxID=2935860 RepID=UPI00200DA475|nr:hypothetical protein [Sphaerisporangium perillae]